MKYFLLYIFIFFYPIIALGQGNSEKDSVSARKVLDFTIPEDIDNRNLIDELHGAKELYDGFILDGRFLTTSFRDYSAPLPIYDYKTYSPVLDYKKLFSISRHLTFGTTTLSHPYTYSFSNAPETLQSATYRFGNGARLITSGEYNANGYRVYNANALPWQRNNFKGAMEFKSANGNFGIRIEVRRGRETPFGF